MLVPLPPIHSPSLTVIDWNWHAQLAKTQVVQSHIKMLYSWVLFLFLKETWHFNIHHQILAMPLCCAYMVFFHSYNLIVYIIDALFQDWSSCSVGCKFGFAADRNADAAFGLHQEPAIASVLRSMESSHYYSENNINVARGWVSTIWFVK